MYIYIFFFIRGPEIYDSFDYLGRTHGAKTENPLLPGVTKLISMLFFGDINWAKEAVYIQIIRSSKSLCTIIEAHDGHRNFRILYKMSGILISLTGNQNSVYAF